MRDSPESSKARGSGVADGAAVGDTTLVLDRQTYSRDVLTRLREELSAVGELAGFPQLTIFAAGSFSRLEASQHSDIDMFFLSRGHRADLDKPNTTSLRLFGKVIDIVERLGLPAFSNDCEYLTLLHTRDIIANLGGRTDDHKNYFTARMLLLLEGQCLYGDSEFEQITKDIVQSYYHDYPNHRDNWVPVFLLNDIARFWKTLLLNYENKRQGLEDPRVAQGEALIGSTCSGLEVGPKVVQSVRNYKLKYSRMTTCFATVAALGSFCSQVVDPGDVFELTQLTPRQRLVSVLDRMPQVENEVETVLGLLEEFLRMTGLTPADLHKEFATREQRRERFSTARLYGNAMYDLLAAIDDRNPRIPLLRYLVI